MTDIETHCQHLSQLLVYCRPGFEKECAAEIQDHALAADLPGYIKTRPDSGYVLYVLHQALDAQVLQQAVRFEHLIFARQCLYATEIIKNLPVDDRISPLCAQIQTLGLKFNCVLLETPDTNEAKQLSGFCKKFSHPLLQSLKQRGLIDEHSDWRLHVFFLSSAAAYLAVSNISNSSPHAMGIMRLHMPRSAPSRSTLKLEEAFKTLLTEQERQRHLRSGMRAVDLGASPGGWTWQMVQRGIHVIAIDNGKMDQALLDSGLVEHIHADGFVYTPPDPVDWLLCDMVERPLHIARLMARWLVEGHSRHAVFNLKLPMKQRYQMVLDCRHLIEEALHAAGKRHEFRARQLYHDREEITCLILQG